MTNQDDEMPFLSSIGFSMTTRCPITCPHCIIEAGPHRKEEMTAQNATDWMEQVAQYRNGHIQSIVLTGGEPFYNLPLLENFLQIAAARKLVVAVMTNAFWAQSPQTARSTLSLLPQIKMLSISTDQYHQRFIPLDNISNAIGAARDLGIMFNVAVCFENENDPVTLQIRKELEKILEPQQIRTCATYPAGRAQRTLKKETWGMTDQPPVGACTAADFPTIFPDGRIIGCMGLLTDLPPGHPLLLGYLRKQSLADILDGAEMNFALHMLRIWGLSALIDLLNQHGCKERLPRKYFQYGYCDLCYALVSDQRLIAALQEIMADTELQQKIAYARLYYLKEDTLLKHMGLSEEPTENNITQE